jgi:hypothetical protein
MQQKVAGYRFAVFRMGRMPFTAGAAVLAVPPQQRSGGVLRFNRAL